MKCPYCDGKGWVNYRSGLPAYIQQRKVICLHCRGAGEIKEESNRPEKTLTKKNMSWIKRFFKKP